MLHAGTSGVGNLTFTGVPTISADTIVLWAGIGDGSASTAIVDFTNAPLLADHTGTGRGLHCASVDGTAGWCGLTDALLTTADFAGAALPGCPGVHRSPTAAM